MRTSIDRRLLVSSAVAAVLWMLFAAAREGLAQIQGPATQLAALVPEVVPSQLSTGESGVWLALTFVIGGVAVAVVHAVSTILAARAGSLMVAAWFATIVAGALVGFALDIAAAWSSLAMFGPRGLLGGMFGTAAASGALWGLAVGWMPGLAARRPAPVAAAPEEATLPTWRPAWSLIAASVALIVVVAGGVAADDARTASIEAEVAAQREAEAAVTFGALPDPEAPGVPVPEAANALTDLEPAWCTPEKAMILTSESDAATGHRSLPIRLWNYSDESCVIEGYPDVAFGDQNQHLLAVTVEQGGSFMAQDPGTQRIEVPAGGYAISILGWDAASPHGALVTKTVFTAPTAGMLRGSWPIDLDIVEGSTVAVTAWAIDTNPVVGE